MLWACTTADSAELIDVHFFVQYSLRTDGVIISTLVERSVRNAFVVLGQIFSDHPRDTNDMFYTHALWLLMALEAKNIRVSWLPTWLAGPERQLTAAIQSLIALSLTSFSTDESRKTVLLAAAALRRIFKLLSIGREDQWRASRLLHAVERYVAAELSWRQMVASPLRQVIQQLDNATILATSRFVKECCDRRGHFLPQSARSKLRELWNTEKALLASIPNYNHLLAERGAGELFPTEASNVVYDNLGHSCICAIDLFPTWKAYALEHHRSDVETLAALGSGRARDWLGLEISADLPRPDDLRIADRFFFGDVSTLEALKSGYGLK